jgi:hypothetical protein
MRLGPSPPMMKYAAGNFAHTMGITPINRSTPVAEVGLYLHDAQRERDRKKKKVNKSEDLFYTQAD